MKKLFLLLINLLGISFYSQALIISEIMYNPQGSDTSREWIEVYNDTGSGVDLSSWKFFEANTNHGLTSSQGGTVVSVNGYAIIAENPTKFLSDYPNFSGVLFDSSFSLSNSGEHLAIKESSSGLEINSVDYDTTIGGDDDGSTLSFINSVWKRGEATPGLENKESVLILDTPTTTTTESNVTITQMSPPTADIVLYLPKEKIVIAGAETNFSTFGLTRKGDSINNLNYMWAFGDGGQGVGSTTIYRYAYPGKYIAQVEGMNGYVLGTGRINVRVVPPDINIIKIGNGKYGTYIDISNPNNYDLDLSQWKLSINGSIFPFPKNTVIAGKTVTTFSGLAMGFANVAIPSESLIKILFPNLEEVAKYVVGKNIIENISTSTVANVATKKIIANIKSEEIIPAKKEIVNPIKTEIKINEVTTSSPAIKVVTNKNTGIADRIKKFFGW